MAGTAAPATPTIGTTFSCICQLPEAIDLRSFALKGDLPGTAMTFTDKSTDKETCAALKTVSNSNQHLTTQADKKAHILIQVNALIISVLIIFILRIKDDHRIALLPVTALMMTCLVVIILALMATRPRMLSRSPVKSAGSDSVNLLFFGSYDALGLDKFHSDMKTLMADDNLIYTSLTRDIYSQAVILGKKYRFLRMSYHVFMTGLAISVVSFIIIAFR
jgi:hypothetical protein